MASQSETTVPLSDIDTDHLAKQAMKLFSKRYGRQYNTSKAVASESKERDHILFSSYPEVCVRIYGMTEEQAMELSLLNWELLTGGCTPEEVPRINKQECIDLCIKGYHSKDVKRTDRLKEVVKQIATMHFDQIDTNHDGIISAEEYEGHAALHGITTNLKGAFEAMDLNGDGEISKEEMLKVYEGFHFYCDEERFNHILGIMED